MSRPRHRRSLGPTGALVAVAIALAGCIGQGSAAPVGAERPGATEIVVYAAASLGDVFRELAAAYEERHPESHVVLSFDASNLLRARIEAGAPADVFAAADTDNPARLTRAGLTEAEPVPFARTELVVVVPTANAAAVDDVYDLARPGVRIVAAGDEVPITRYARTLLARIGALPPAPHDFTSQVERNVASREDNVRAVLTKVELGEADAGIVYRTDVATNARVRSIAIPAGVNVDVTYAAVAVRQPGVAAERELGTAFVAWLRSETASAILARTGFRVP